MEGILILIGIYLLEVVIKKVAVNKKNKSEDRDSVPDESFSQEPDEASQPQPKRSLQDLIRQFEEAQRDASGGTYVPPSPEVEDYADSEDNDGLPVVQPAKPGEFTFGEIAESVVQWEYVSVELLQEAFGFSECIAQQVLAELQAKRIVGRDMGEGECDLLVHDKVELDNLFKRLQREAEEQQAAQQQAALQARREAEMKHQKELAELEERARQICEQSTSGITPEDIVATGAVSASTTSRPQSRSFNKAEIRRGFIWAKVLDEPRFKKRWNARVR